SAARRRVWCVVSSLFFCCSRASRDLHSFPTRRSSDLTCSASKINGERICRYCSRCCNAKLVEKVIKLKYLAMIQARCGSSRLPNKVLMPLCDKPVLQWIIERVQKSKLIDEVMVVTSIDKNNLPILSLCSQMGVRVGVGSEDDVLDRFYQTAKLLKPEYAIRITADCPCFD